MKTTQHGALYMIEQKLTHGTFERIEARINYYHLAEALSKGGLIPEGFSVEHAHFDDDNVLEVSLVRETITGDNEIYQGIIGTTVKLGPRP
jgi:hypothetical protein